MRINSPYLGVNSVEQSQRGLGVLTGELLQEVGNCKGRDGTQKRATPNHKALDARISCCVRKLLCCDCCRDVRALEVTAAQHPGLTLPWVDAHSACSLVFAAAAKSAPWWQKPTLLPSSDSSCLTGCGWCLWQADGR